MKDTKLEDITKSDKIRLIKNNRCKLYNRIGKDDTIFSVNDIVYIRNYYPSGDTTILKKPCNGPGKVIEVKNKIITLQTLKDGKSSHTKNTIK